MISIIIPTYNRAHLIKRSIDSVLKQTYQDIEVIIVDDASTDNTEEIVKNIKNNKIKYIKLPTNSGACIARNKGIIESKGKYIAFLDSDDEWDENKLQLQYEYIKKTKCDVVVSNFIYEDKKMHKKLIIDENHKSIITLAEILNKSIVTTGVILATKEILENVGMFDENMPRFQDWDLIIRLAKVTRIHLINKPLLLQHYQNVSITGNLTIQKKNAALERIYKKNMTTYINYPKSNAHICWMIGIGSLFTEKINYKKLELGVYGYGFNIKRYIIYMLIKLGFKGPVKKLYIKKRLDK